MLYSFAWRDPYTGTGDVDQPLALFLPGIMTVMADTCLRVLPLIRMFDIVVCDLPGHGTSGEVDDVSPSAFAQEYAALIDRYIPGPQQIYIVGESYGGLVGAALAAMRPDRFRHLFLLDTPLCLTRPPLRALLTARWQGYSLSPYIRRILLEVFNFDPQDGAPREAQDLLFNVPQSANRLHAACRAGRFCPRRSSRRVASTFPIDGCRPRRIGDVAARYPFCRASRRPDIACCSTTPRHVLQPWPAVWPVDIAGGRRRAIRRFVLGKRSQLCAAAPHLVATVHHRHALRADHGFHGLQ